MGKLTIRPQSYSSLSLFQNCPMQYKLKYIDGNYSKISTLPLELGTLLHKVLELRYLPIDDKSKAYSLEDLLKILHEGYALERIAGLDELKNKYFEDFITQGRKSGLTYSQKINTFINDLTETFNENADDLGDNWSVLACELPFEIKYDKDIVIGGKIDRVDINSVTGDLRVIDYKSSDAVYDERDLNNALQMYVYSLAIQKLYNKVPVEYVYNFILLGQKAYALTKKNYQNTMQKKLQKTIDELKENYNTKEFKPKPTPLCYWCPYNCQGCVNDKDNNHLCDYFSLWTPTEKTFAVNKEWECYNAPTEKTQKDTGFIW